VQATQSSITVPAPVGVVAGDILVAGFGVDITGSFNGTNNKIVPTIAGWTVVANNDATADIRVLWKVATASEPSSYTFNIQNSLSQTSPSYVNAIIGAWEGFTAPTQVTLATLSRFRQVLSINDPNPPGPPNVEDIDSVTITGSETTTGGLAVYLWNISSTIENFDGTVGTEGNPPYPASVPWNTTVLQPSLDQHEQIHYEGLPVTPGGGEGTIVTLQDNKMLTLGSQVLSSGVIPDGTAAFTWQHAGDEAGYLENVRVYRLVLQAAIDEAYWGIHAVPL
jgi:hypothetical protein